MNRLVEKPWQYTPIGIIFSFLLQIVDAALHFKFDLQIELLGLLFVSQLLLSPYASKQIK
jgi:hypothetical protein